MRRSGAVDQLTAHCGLASLPDAWVDMAHGRLSAKEATRRAREIEEDETLVRRTARMLQPPTAAQSKARQQVVLDQWSAGLDQNAEPAPIPSSGRWIFGVVSLMAAAVLLVVVPRARPGVGRFDAGYALELDRALAVQRDPGQEEAVARYRMDRPIQFRVRPKYGVIETVDVRLFAVRTDGLTVPVAVESKISDRGVVEVLGTPRAWGLLPGRWTLTAVVGPPSGLPSAMGNVRMVPDAPYDVDQADIEVLE
ncbi:hypothetical protein [Paraliomyxa miuraensis]|uniref:hypothetical protein n=1 Tax=Paraliomyxa miuraensis TaxID=376150 RepID=UPI00225BA346|nr:hypothetical protein [Paraliomyxa miuraensis]MCX4240449.1 hypothetical protein [Paraliomyxa miuraensis]